ncbi:MAG: hypothetical protein AB7T74_05100 [Clostridia bacterium]
MTTFKEIKMNEDGKNMQKRRGLLVVVMALVALSWLAGCAGGPEQATGPKPGARSGTRFELSLQPGPEYAKDMKVFLFKYTVWPQVAVWLEKPDGSFVDTLYVTELAVTKDYRAAPKEGRPEALPVWSALKRAGVDGVSSPTTVGATVEYGNDLAARLPAGTYIVKLETNRSYDWNSSYTKDNAGVNGQPSLIYAAELTIGGAADEASFVPVGTGSVDGSDGTMRPGLEGIDTALQLFASMKVAYIPE